MISILICGEGYHDVGSKEWDKKTGAHVWCEGWMQPLVRKIEKNDIEFKTKYLKELFLSPRPQVVRPALKGQADKAAIAKLIAKIEGCKAVIYMTDADSKLEKDREQKILEILNGFEIVDNDVVAVPCVPMGTSECWLLSDLTAWESLGLKSTDNFPKQPPEDLWGARNDPVGNHPKHVFARVAADADTSDSRDTRNRVCESSSLEVMIGRCPKSLGNFAQVLCEKIPNTEKTES